MKSLELNEAERLASLQLIRTENVGPITFRQLLGRFGSATRALEALPDLAARGGRKRPLRAAEPRHSEEELARLIKAGGGLLVIGEAAYPAALAAIEDAPPVLALRGRKALLSAPLATVVGARNASTNGRRIAASLGRRLAEEGIAVVSGLARGIDAAAHRGALDAGSETTTIAVIAGGLDRVYPPEHQALQEEIATRGLLVSEAPLGTEPQARHFPRRNRLVSGLSLGVVVVEGALRSGSLITARMASEQGREVMAVPGSPLDPRAQGPNSLIRQGATLVQSSDDVLECLQPLIAPPLAEAPGRHAAGRAEEIPAEPAGEGSDADQAVLLDLLSPTAVPVDEVIRRCHLSPSLIQSLLLELELAGRLERQAGNRVALIV
ncbi:MAG: DNA-protecting protein DprA [Rhodospirillales bacterium]|nr:DNA-protecting protein DprA [Rhodospirillales bacterium]